MAVTATLVRATGNRLTYLLSQDGTAGTTLDITATGAATPDLLTDTAGHAGPLRQLAKANSLGYGAIATPMTQAKARAILLSDYTGASPAQSGSFPTARCLLTERSGTAGDWQVDANAAANNMLIAITAPAGAADVYLDVFVPGVEGV